MESEQAPDEGEIVQVRPSQPEPLKPVSEIIEFCYKTRRGQRPHPAGPLLGYWAVPTFEVTMKRLQDPGTFGSVLGKVPPDVVIVGKCLQTQEQMWSIRVHAPILCAHSEYARAFLTHGRTTGGNLTSTTETQNSPELKARIELDGHQISREVMQTLIEACYLGRCPPRLVTEESLGLL